MPPPARRPHAARRGHPQFRWLAVAIADFPESLWGKFCSQVTCLPSLTRSLSLQPRGVLASHGARRNPALAKLGRPTSQRELLDGDSSSSLWRTSQPSHHGRRIEE